MMASYVDLIGRIEAQIRTFRIAWISVSLTIYGALVLRHF